MKKEIFCTLGPSSLNKDFLKFSNNKISLLRINLSHISLNELTKTIKFIRKYSKVPICLDTEGAQIRTKSKYKKFFKKNKLLKFFKDKGKFKLYPDTVFEQIKKKDILDIGFEGLKVKVMKKDFFNITCKVISEGFIEGDKGVHLVNRKIKLNFITNKDKLAIQIGKKLNINNYALSFTNSYSDVLSFNKLLNKEKKIFKIETKNAIKNLSKIIANGEKFLIDRGDLSKDIKIEELPYIQRVILKMGNKNKKKIYVATNFLESMLFNKYPLKGEINDIYNTLELGASGLVLAAETAIGNYPKECVTLLKKVIIAFKKFNKKKIINFISNS